MLVNDRTILLWDKSGLPKEVLAFIEPQKGKPLAEVMPWEYVMAVPMQILMPLSSIKYKDLPGLVMLEGKLYRLVITQFSHHSTQSET